MSIEKNTNNILVHEDGGFSTLINETIFQIKHTGALGVYTYLASKQSNWVICQKELQNHFGCGKSHINTCFKILKDLKAIETKSIRDEKGKIVGWETTLRRKIPKQNVYLIQNTENRYSGESKSELPTIPVSQILEKPESGKTAPINKRSVKNKRLLKKTNNKGENPVSVFSDKDSVETHINQVLANRGDFVEDEIVKQGIYYAFETNADKSFASVNKRINIFLKLVREGKWLIPQGFNGITSQSIREKEENHSAEKQIQYQQEAKAFKEITKNISGIGHKNFSEEMKKMFG